MSLEPDHIPGDPTSLIRLSPTGRAVVRSISHPSTPLIGRQQEIEELAGLVRDRNVRLITIAGTGGIGKTRLAIEIAHTIDDNVVFVPLAETSTGMVASAIIHALGREQRHANSPEDFLRDQLGTGRWLLVLDNFEHLLTASGLVSDLVGSCPELTILVTSRTRLGIGGEHVVALNPLDVPSDVSSQTLEQVAASEAVQLFVDRARAAHRAFALSEHNARDVVTICQRLDGLPLAIELAAARSNLLSPQALAARLEHRLVLLTGGPTDAPARLQTMRAAISWSSDLLGASERMLWERLSIFAGGFTASAAEALAEPTGTTGDAPLAMVESLVNKGLIQPSVDRFGEPRLTMLQTTREYALEQLEARGLERETREAHASWFEQFAALAEPELKSTDPTIWFNRVAAEIANVRAALAWRRDTGQIEAALRLANHLAWFWTDPNYLTEGRSWFDSLLALADGTVDRTVLAAASMAAGDLAHWQADTQQALSRNQQALVLWREMDDEPNIVACLRSLGSIAIDRFAPDEARSLLQEAHDLAITIGDSWNAAAAANLLGIIATDCDDPALATQWHETALHLWRSIGDEDHLSSALNGLGWAWLGQGEHQLAWDSFDAAITLSGEEHPSFDTAWGLVGLSALAAPHNPSAAARMMGSAANQRRVLNLPLRPTTQLVADAMADRLREAIGSAAFTLAWQEGEAESLPDAIAQARRESQPPSPVSELSRREREVLDLLVEGASDHEIADRLFITRRTASKHVAAILEKLGASNRTAAATIAHRRGLIPNQGAHHRSR